MHLAGCPGSYFAYLKDYLKEWSRKLLECRLVFYVSVTIFPNNLFYISTHNFLY